ncbi:MAG TPA: hypothetical protein VFE05_12345 [Longimicrobiaceae bacterium]|jgi:hypothetical protein|nr:hypothetical protein [Longimicrobiaceae bacterium]
MSEHTHDHDHDHEGEETFGMAIGFRIFDDEGELFLAEAEITPYVDEPTALGATLVFHPLSDLDPTAQDEEIDWPAWPLDIDEDLVRDNASDMGEQFRSILRQLSALSEVQLREYLQAAREEAASDDDDEEEGEA